MTKLPWPFRYLRRWAYARDWWKRPLLLDADYLPDDVVPGTYESDMNISTEWWKGWKP